MSTSGRVTQLLAVLDAADAETRGLLDSVSDADLSKRTDESNWNVGQLCGHIAQVPWATYVLGRLSQNKNATSPAPLGFLLHLGNWWNVRRFKDTTKARLLDTWNEGFAKYREYVAALPDDVLDNGGEVTGRGRMTVAEFIHTASDHAREHGDTIRKALQASGG